MDKLKDRYFVLLQRVMEDTRKTSSNKQTIDVSCVCSIPTGDFSSIEIYNEDFLDKDNNKERKNGV